MFPCHKIVTPSTAGTLIDHINKHRAKLVVNPRKTIHHIEYDQPIFPGSSTDLGKCLFQAFAAVLSQAEDVVSVTQIIKEDMVAIQR